MPERVTLTDGAVTARVELDDGYAGELDLFVARGAAATLPRDGVLLREGSDHAVVRHGGWTREVPLFKMRPDGSLARVRVARIAERRHG